MNDYKNIFLVISKNYYYNKSIKNLLLLILAKLNIFIHNVNNKIYVFLYKQINKEMKCWLSKINL